MSTKIYNAWEWPNSYNDLIKWFNSIKKNEYFQDSFNTARRIKIEENEEKFAYINRAYKTLLNAKNSLEKCFVDIDLSCVIIQYSNKIVVCFFGLEKYSFPTVFKEVESNFKYFGYWDNVDSQEGISEEEWNCRREWFEKVFNEYESKIYSEISLIYDFSDSNNIFNICDRISDEKFLSD